MGRMAYFRLGVRISRVLQKGGGNVHLVFAGSYVQRCVAILGGSMWGCLLL